MGTTPITNHTTNKMRCLSMILVLAFVGMCAAIPVAQQAAAGTPGQGDQRIFGNLLGAVQGAAHGLFNPQQYNNNFGFGWGNQGGYGYGYNQGGYGGGYGGYYNPYQQQVWG